MDCRNARLLIADESAITPDQQRALRTHLAQCAACRDDAADPVGRVLTHLQPGMVAPPPTLTTAVLQRLPREAPAELRLMAIQRRRQRWRRGAIGGALALGAFVLLGLLLRGVWSGSGLGLMADGIMLVIAESLAPLAVMLGSAVVLIWLLRLLLERPTAINALGSATLAAILLAVSATSVSLNDRGNLARSGSQSIATVAESIDFRASDGAAASLFGDIVVRGPVAGPVITLAGAAQLESSARVTGDVAAGAGTVIEPGGQVIGSIRQTPGGAALGAVVLSAESTATSPTLVRAVAGLLIALLSLSLAALLILLWPQRTLAMSRVLPERPWAALGIGALLTAVLALLALPTLALLAVTVVGLALVPALLLLIHVVYVQGLAAVGQALGQRLTGAATTASALWGVAAQLVVVLLLSLYAPLAGLAAFYLLASLGLGAQLLQWRGAGQTAHGEWR